MNKLLLFFLLVLSVTLVPSFGALDKANTQWLVLSLIPFVFFNSISFYNSSKIFIIYGIFVLQVFLSLLYTNNYSISFIDISRHITLFLLLGIFLNLLIANNLSFYKICFLISLILVVESIISLLPLFSFIYDNGLSFSNIKSVDLNQFKGLTGNRNITTASIAIKLSFLLYLIYKSKLFARLFYASIATLPLLSLFIINSRAALLSFLIIIIFTFLFFLFIKRNKIGSLLFILGSAIISFSLSAYILPSKSIQTAQRLSSINFTNESSSQRFFLWENAIDYILSNPFIGCGIGNWKVESAAYWGSLGNNYLVPYHAHNDFLEFATELGIVGGLTYFVLFCFISISLFMRILLTKSFKFVVLFTSFIALFIDSLLNFPFERPIIQIMFLLLMGLTIFFTMQPNEK